MQSIPRWLTGGAAFAVLALMPLHGAEPEVEFKSVSEPRPADASSSLNQGSMSLQFVTGALGSPVGIGPDTDTFNYTMSNLRLGYILSEPDLDGHPLDGAVELLLELSGSAVFEGAGSYLIGPTLLVRYQFVQPDWPVIPYVQAGAGLVFTDAHEDQSQRAIGQELEFTPQASIGLRYPIDPTWSVDAEFIYHHISNAGLADRNLGINALGGMVGFTYRFR